MKDEDDYEEGDEFLFRNEIEENIPQDVHYELLYAYGVNGYLGKESVVKCYGKLTEDFVLEWRDFNSKHIHKALTEIYVDRDFNDVIAIDAQFYD